MCFVLICSILIKSLIILLLRSVSCQYVDLWKSTNGILIQHLLYFILLKQNAVFYSFVTEIWNIRFCYHSSSLYTPAGKKWPEPDRVGLITIPLIAHLHLFHFYLIIKTWTQESDFKLEGTGY